MIDLLRFAYAQDPAGCVASVGLLIGFALMLFTFLAWARSTGRES